MLKILGLQCLADSEGISNRFDPADSLQPSNEGDYEYSVALDRINPNGKAVVVFGTNKNALVKAVLTEAGQGKVTLVNQSLILR